MTRSLKLSALVSLVAYAGSAAALLWHRNRAERERVLSSREGSPKPQEPPTRNTTAEQEPAV